MNKLSSYWRRKKQAVQNFLSSNPVDPAPGGNIATLRNWLNRLIVAPAPGQKSLEDLLELALEDVNTKRADVTNGPGGNPKNKRRSARLIHMVQGTVGASPAGSGYFSAVGHIAQGTAHGLIPYHRAVEAASEAAANFINAAKNTDFGGTAAIFEALDRLIRANDLPGANPVILDELKGLRVSIDLFLARGGAGDGSAYWPSVFISSSSTSVAFTTAP